VKLLEKNLKTGKITGKWCDFLSWRNEWKSTLAVQVFFEFWILLMNGNAFVLCCFRWIPSCSASDEWILLYFAVDVVLFCVPFVICLFLLPLWWLLERAVKVHRNMMTALIGSLQVHLAALPKFSVADCSKIQPRALRRLQVHLNGDCSTARAVKFGRWPTARRRVSSSLDDCSKPYRVRAIPSSSDHWLLGAQAARDKEMSARNNSGGGGGGGGAVVTVKGCQLVIQSAAAFAKCDCVGTQINRSAAWLFFLHEKNGGRSCGYSRIIAWTWGAFSCSEPSCMTVRDVLWKTIISLMQILLDVVFCLLLMLRARAGHHHIIKPNLWCDNNNSSINGSFYLLTS
jgi:hypothetical protein